MVTALKRDNRVTVLAELERAVLKAAAKAAENGTARLLVKAFEEKANKGDTATMTSTDQN